MTHVVHFTQLIQGTTIEVTETLDTKIRSTIEVIKPVRKRRDFVRKKKQKKKTKTAILTRWDFENNNRF